MTVQLVTNDRIAQTSSKGNQEKWYEAESGCWYKVDQYGYETLSETLISRLLERSNVESEFPFRFVRYSPERLNVHGRERVACRSADFLKPGQSIVTLGQLFRQMYGVSAKELLQRLSSDKKRIEWLGVRTAELTGLADFPRYLTLLFEVDALFLNEDRHLNNIAVLREGEAFDYCPIFDNAAALLSNTQIYRMDVEPAALIKTVRASPLGTTFNRQIIAARSLFGSQLRMDALTRDDIRDELAPLLPYYAERDRGLITDRVCACILTRLKMM